MNTDNIFRLNKGGVGKSRLQTFILSLIHGYNHQKYWKRRSIVIDSANKTNILIKIYYLFWIKRVDAKYHCSFGTRLNSGAQFTTPPYLPHGPNGIIVGHDAIVGKEVIIYHQVTIAGGNVVIGDHSELGAGAKILPNVTIGKFCHVGANAVVVENMPDYSTCVLSKPRIILKNENSTNY